MFPRSRRRLCRRRSRPMGTPPRLPPPPPAPAVRRQIRLFRPFQRRPRLRWHRRCRRHRLYRWHRPYRSHRRYRRHPRYLRFPRLRRPHRFRRCRRLRPSPPRLLCPRCPRLRFRRRRRCPPHPGRAHPGSRRFHRTRRNHRRAPQLANTHPTTRAGILRRGSTAAISLPPSSPLYGPAPGPLLQYSSNRFPVALYSRPASPPQPRARSA